MASASRGPTSAGGPIAPTDLALAAHAAVVRFPGEREPPSSRPKFAWKPSFSLTINGASLGLSYPPSDEPIDVSSLVVPGRNTVVFRHHGLETLAPRPADHAGASHVLLLYLARARPTPDVVLALTTDPKKTLSASKSRERIARSFGASPRSRARAQSDASDGIECLETERRLPLRCPLSMSVMSAANGRTPARGRLCAHVQCFDLETYLHFNRRRLHEHRNADLGTEGARKKRTRKWRCPVPFCDKAVGPEDVVCDAYVSEIVAAAAAEDPDAEYALVRADGSWTTQGAAARKRVKTEGADG